MGLNKVTYVDGSTVITAANLNNIQDAVIALEGQGGFDDGVKQALLQIASKVAYIDDDGQDYYDALESALYPSATLVSISAVYTQSGYVYNTDTLDYLRTDLVVTAHYEDSSTATVTAYILSGTLTAGTSTITVSYAGKTTTFTVEVTQARVPASLVEVEYIENNPVSASSSAWIPLSVLPASPTSVKYVISFQEVVSSYSAPNGYYPISTRQKTTEGNIGYGLNMSNNHKTITAWSGGSGAVITADETYTRHDITTEWTSSSINVQEGSGTVVSASYTTRAIGNYPVTLFASRYESHNTIEYPFAGKIFSAKVYVNGTLTHDLIPCRYENTNTPCFYDTVNNVAYDANGSNTLTVGDDVPIVR